MITITKQEFKYMHHKQSKHTHRNKKQANKTKSMSCVPNPKQMRFIPKDIQKLQKDAQSTMTNINKLHSHGWITDVQVEKCRNLMNYNLAKHYVQNKDKAFIPSPNVRHRQLADTMKDMNAHEPKDSDYNLSNQVVTMINGGATNINANPNEMASPTQSNRFLHHELRFQNFKHWHPKITKVANFGSRIYHQHLASYISNGRQHVSNFTDKAFNKIIQSQHKFTKSADDYGKKVKTINIKSKFNHLVHGLKGGIHGFKNNFNQSASDELHRKFNGEHRTRANHNYNQESNHHMSRMERLHHRSQGFNR